MQEETTISIFSLYLFLPVYVNWWSAKWIFSDLHVNHVRVIFVRVKGCTS